VLSMRRQRPPPWALPFDPRATEDDISACFRLLLGRRPNREEWRGHAMRVGEDLAGVVASYVQSLEFSRRGLLARNYSGAIGSAEFPGFRIYADAADAAVGRHVLAGSYEPEVSAVLRDRLLPGMGVVDIGANIGYFTLLAASLVGPSGFVLAVEPNPRNVRLLEASRRSNGFAHVKVAQTAAGAYTDLVVLHASYSNGTTSPAPDAIDDLLASETVACIGVDALLGQEQRIDLIKVDVEGAEYQALRGCRRAIARWRPAIVSEFSPSLLAGVSGISCRAYLHWLVDQGYGLSVIQPDGSLRQADDAEEIIGEYERRETDHLDLLATPLDQPAVHDASPALAEGHGAS
jgi:FkbM family methyltransferase